MRLPAEILVPIVNRISLAHELRPDVVMCVILQESNGDTSANRFEERTFELLRPQLRVSLSGWTPGPNQAPNLITEKINRATSWGLMQVLGETARWCAKCTMPYLTEILNPEVGVEVGCRVLAYYLGRNDGNYPMGLAAYNAGRASSPQGQVYANKVLERIRKGEHLNYFKEASNE